MNSKDNPKVVFDSSMIAPCGMNCGTCMTFMKSKNRCTGCRVIDKNKPQTCTRCVIMNCYLLNKTESKFCYDCPKYPCSRLKEVDKRYRKMYDTCLLDDLNMIKEKGIEKYLAFETQRRTCPNCGATLSVHKKSCFVCGLELVYAKQL